MKNLVIGSTSTRLCSCGVGSWARLFDTPFSQIQLLQNYMPPGPSLGADGTNPEQNEMNEAG